MIRCAACRREAGAVILEPTLSVLDFRLHDLCPACIDHQAEPLHTLVKTVNSTGWRDLPAEIRQAIRVYDMGDYVPVRDWANRLSQRQVVVRRRTTELEAADEAAFQEVKKLWNRMTLPNRPPGRGQWLIAILTFFLPWRPV